MRSFLLIIIISLGYGNIKFTPHTFNIGEIGILSIHSADINGDWIPTELSASIARGDI